MKRISLFLLLFLFSCTNDPIVYTLTATAEPAEGGQVVPEFMEYGEGDTAYVVATPSDEYVLESWSGDASGNANTIVITMDKNKEVTANFIKKKYPLTIKIEGEGEVKQEVIKQGAVTDYNSGTIVKLTAEPDEEWEFVRWRGDITGNENPTQITIDEPKTVVAEFIKKKYPLTIEIEGEGTVDQKIIKQGVSTDYNSGTVLELTALSDDGWEFVEWKEDLSGSVNPQQITIDGPKTVKAVFTESKVYIPDDNFEQYLIDIGVDDILDDYVLQKSIDTLRTIVIRTPNKYPDTFNVDDENKTIKSMRGIDSFTSLEKLEVWWGRFESIDLNKLTELKDLRLYYGKLKTIDLSNNNELKILNLRWNELRNLNVSNLIELEGLNFRDNHISEIDLSSNSNLEYLYAFGNNLSDVDLSNNNSLRSVYLNKYGWKVGYSELYDEISNNSIQNIVLPNENNINTLQLAGSLVEEIDMKSFEKLVSLNLMNSQTSVIKNLDLISNLNSLNVNNTNLNELVGYSGSIISFAGTKIEKFDATKMSPDSGGNFTINVVHSSQKSETPLECLQLTREQIDAMGSYNIDLPARTKISLNCFNNTTQQDPIIGTWTLTNEQWVGSGTWPEGQARGCWKSGDQGSPDQYIFTESSVTKKVWECHQDGTLAVDLVTYGPISWSNQGNGNYQWGGQTIQVTFENNSTIMKLPFDDGNILQTWTKN